MVQSKGKSTEVTHTPNPVPVRFLDEASQCDRCPSRAWVRVDMEPASLFFCGHHYRRHAAVLEALGVPIVDDTDVLAARFGPSPLTVRSAE